MSKKILFVIGNLDTGGAENHICQLLPLLKEKGIIPAVYTLTHKGRQSDQLESKEIPVYEPPHIKRLRKYPFFIKKPLITVVTFLTLWRLIIKTHPDIIHFFLPTAYILGGLCSLLTPVPKRIMSRRSLRVYSNNRPHVRLVERLLHRRMDLLLGNSRAVVKQLEEECTNHKKIRLIYNGVKLDMFKINGTQKTIREEQGISDDCIVVTMVANILHYKGHEDLINAISIIDRDAISEFIILCVGRDDGTGTELKELARKLNVADKIQWLGERNDVPDILCASDIGLLCSHQEGFSNGILEAMAAGLPMIVTDVGGNKEAVIDGVCGLVVPSHEPAFLSRALIKMMESKEKRERMGNASKKRVEEKFTQEICVKYYLDLYETI